MTVQQPTALPFPVPRVLEILQTGEIDDEYGIMRWSSNYAFLITLTLDADKIMAVYKPQRGERPLWDFPDGTLCLREQASFVTSEALGWQIVPPTVLREGARGQGTMQFFIDHDPEVHYFTLDDALKMQLQRMAIFDVVVNNADRKGGHCLLDSASHIWGIDHGLTFHQAHKLRTVIWDYAGQPIPTNLLADLQTLYDQVCDDASPYRQRLDPLLAIGEVTALEHRLRKLLRLRTYPVPSASGPNYPWPAV